MFCRWARQAQQADQAQTTGANRQGAYKADVALLLEGTYPYIRGGVSSWVHQIITGLPEVSFGLIFLGGQASAYGKQQYELPPNVKHLEHHYLMDAALHKKGRARSGSAKAFKPMRDLHEQFKRDQPVEADVLQTVFNSLGMKDGVSHEDMMFSKEAWAMMTDSYTRYCTEPSFIDYFWSVRIMHSPLFMLSNVARNLPQFRAVHSISTGYAGLLGAMIASQRKCPFVLTEHGIYTKERKIDLAQAGWIYDPQSAVSGTLNEDVGYIRQMWIRFFEVIGRLTYQQASPIISLYEGNRQRQVDDGADVLRTEVIPNGIDPDKFIKTREARPQEIPLVLGLIGRVVPIKDIKTFIRAMRAVCDELPTAEGWIAGPEDEDESYVAECKDLVQSLGLADNVKFLGFQNIHDLLPKLGLMVLTSISEALPLVILEAYAAGLPCLATDVGSCRELIYGGSAEDQALGSAGAIVPIADPDATARAMLRLINNPKRWHAAQAVGLERVQRFYTQKMMFDAYRRIYTKAIA